LVDDSRPALGQFLRRIAASTEDVEDIVQETYLRVYENREDFDPQFSVKTWMYTIAPNVLRDRARRRTARPEPPAEPAFDNGRPDRKLEARELAERVRTLIQSLPEGQREVFTLYRYEGLSYADIGRTIGISVGAVKAHMHHALKKIREGLHRLGYPS